MLFFLLSYNVFVMKLFNSKEDALYLTKTQWRKIFLATSILVLLLYLVAMAFSLCGSKYFILDYQNEQMDKIEAFLKQYKIYPLAMWFFTTIEFFVVCSFVIKRVPKWYYVLTFYSIAMIVSATVPTMPTIFYQIYPFLFYIVIPLIEQIKDNHKSVYKEHFSFKTYLKCILRLLIAIAITLLLQAMILVIKAGYFDGKNHVMNLSATCIYALEYDIALSVILFTISLFINREKGDSRLWEMFQVHGGSSQTSKKQSQTSLLKKNLTKTQRNKIRLLLFKVYLIQISAFLLVMVLPFLLGKVFEFLMMYTAFCVARYILGFKYSLHYKKEVTCVTVGVIVFGILSLAVPFFYVVLVMAIMIGVGLAILLHLSYKYKGLYLFAKVAKPDKFALLYTYFDGDLNYHHVNNVCKYKNLSIEQTKIICDYVNGDKISYLAKKYNYSQRMFIYKLDEAIEKLTS